MSQYRKIKKPPIIAIGGTKGKTTIARLLSHLYTKSGHHTLLVDTDGHYVNGKMKGSLNDSMELYGLVPTNCPGRFLHKLKNKPNPIAILETAYNCYLYGLGYSQHKYAIFTNVLKDHIGFHIKNRSVRFNIHRKIGDTSKIVSDAIQKKQKDNRQAHQIISEEKAIKYAFSIAEKGDCLVHIVNDDHKKSIAYLKKYLNK